MLRDLAMGARFAVSGGREGWIRLTLTAVGVGLGVAVLLLTTAVPSALERSDAREHARYDAFAFGGEQTRKSDRSLLTGKADTKYRGDDVRGRLLQPEGPQAPPPPGLAAIPAPGEMAVSPALRDLLASDEGALLRERLPHRISGTVAPAGLAGPHELVYYAGAEGLRVDGSTVLRMDSWGWDSPEGDGPPALIVLLAAIMIAILLMPVAVFIAAAVRMGGERRDRRLAALRLIGADARMVRRVAAGESLIGAALGLGFGAGVFAAGRAVVERVVVFDGSVFSSDLTPHPALAALVALAVPLAAVGVTLFSLRGVVIEPLGVVRTATPRRRRLWWRLVPPVGGLAVLYPLANGDEAGNGDVNEAMAVFGTVCLLIGVTALLPWVVEAVVARLGRGAPSWQLAVRRMQLSSGTAARTVNGVAVAVAGAIALQMLFSGVAGQFTEETGQDPSRAQMAVNVPGEKRAEVDRALNATEGVSGTSAIGMSSLGEKAEEPEEYVQLTVGDCAALRQVAKLPSCRDGEVFSLRPDPSSHSSGWDAVRPGARYYIDPSYGEPGEEVPWQVPPEVTSVEQRRDAGGVDRTGTAVTPGALPAGASDAVEWDLYVRLDASVPYAEERVRNTVAALGPTVPVNELAFTREASDFTSLRIGLLIGATCVLLLVGASLLVSQLEQLRERRRLLSTLIAFGTRRRTLALSVLWQTALPITLGLVLASLIGMLLGAVLLRLAGSPLTVDWTPVAAMTGIGAGVVALVTVLSLPPLLRMLRPDGLRTE